MAFPGAQVGQIRRVNQRVTRERAPQQMCHSNMFLRTAIATFGNASGHNQPPRN